MVTSLACELASCSCCLGIQGAWGLFPLHSNADLLSVTPSVCFLLSSSVKWLICFLQSRNTISLGDDVIGVFNFSGAAFQLITRSFPPSVQVYFTRKLINFPFSRLFFGLLGTLPFLYLHLSEVCLAWLLWSTGLEAATDLWAKNDLGRVGVYIGGPLFCASGAGEYETFASCAMT